MRPPLALILRETVTGSDWHAGDIYQILDKDKGLQPDYWTTRHRSAEEQICA